MKIWAPAALGLLLVGALASSCATEEEVTFGEPSRVAGGIPDRPEDVVLPCEVNGACTVSWANDIFPMMFDGEVGGETPSGGCTESTCHADGAGGLIMQPGGALEAYFGIVDYQLVGGKSYVVGCHPELSHIMCNLNFASGVRNDFVGPDEIFTGGCGSGMPKPSETVDTDLLDQSQLDMIAEWILCGAPRN